MLQDALNDVGAVVDAELVWDGQQEGVRLGDGLVGAELLDEDVGLGGIAAAEDGAGPLAEEADLVLLLAAAAEVVAVAVVQQRDDAAADRDARGAGVAGCLPGSVVGADLLGLLDV